MNKNKIIYYEQPVNGDGNVLVADFTAKKTNDVIGQAGAASDIGVDGIYPTIAYVNETTTLWVQVVDNHMGNLCGSISYPLA